MYANTLIMAPEYFSDAVETEDHLDCQQLTLSNSMVDTAPLTYQSTTTTLMGE